MQPCSHASRRAPRRATALAYASALGAASLLAPSLASPQARAADFWWAGDVGQTWNTGAGGNTNFSTSGVSNVNSTALPGSADVVRFSTPGAANLGTTLGQDFSLLGLRLEPGATAVSVAGNTLTLGAAGVTNASTSTLTLNSALLASGSGFSFSATGGGQIAVGGNLDGVGKSLLKAGTGTLTITGVCSFTGPTTVSTGTLELSRSGGFSASSGITVPVGATLRLSGTDIWGGHFITASSPLSVSGTVASNGSFNTLVSPTFNGGTLLLSGGYQAIFPAIALKGTVSVTGSTASQFVTTGAGSFNAISLGPTNVPGSTTFDVSDVTASSAVDLTIAVPLQNNQNLVGSASPSGLRKAGPGTLALSASNSYTGGTTLAGGNLQFLTPAALPATGSITFTGGTLQYTGSNVNDHSARIAGSTAAIAIDTNGLTITFASPLAASNTGGLSKLGTGTLVLTASNAYIGTTTLAGGILRTLTPAALPAPGNLSFSGGTLQYVGTNLTDYSARISGSTGAVAVDTGSETVTFASSLAASNTGGLFKLGSGALVLAATNAYTGPTVINGGTLVTAIAGAVRPLSSVTVNSGGTVRLSVNDLWGNFQTSATSLVTINAGGTVTSSNSFTTLIGLNLNGGTLVCDGGANANLPAFAVRGTVTVGGAQPSLITAGSGTFNAINVGSPAGLDNTTFFTVADVTLDPAADLTIAVPLQNNFNGFVPLPAGIAKLGPGTLVLTAANAYTRPTEVVAGTLQLGDGGTSGSVNGDVYVSTGAVLAFNRADDVAFGFAVSGLGRLNKLGTGTLTLSAANTYAGGTALAGGVLQLLAPEALPSTGSISFTGGTLQYAGSNTSDYSARIAGSTAAVAIDTNGSDVTFATPLAASNTGGLVKVGAGRLIYSGAGGPVGPLVVRGGAFALHGSLSSPSITVAPTGSALLVQDSALTSTTGSLALAVAPGSDATYFLFSGTLDASDVRVGVGGSGNVVQTGGLLRVSNGVTLGNSAGSSGGYELKGGFLEVTSGSISKGSGSAGFLFDGGIVIRRAPSADLFPGHSPRIGASGAFFYLEGNTTILSPLVRDPSLGSARDGGLTKSGAALVLAGDNTYVGRTLIADGQLGVGNGGTTGSIAGDIVNQGSLAFNRSDSYTYTGSISGGGELIKGGAGTLELAGNRVVAGDLRVLSGTLRTTTSMSALAVYLQPGSSLNVRSGPFSAFFVESQAASVTIDSGSLFIETSFSSFGGSLTINGGTLDAPYIDLVNCPSRLDSGVIRANALYSNRPLFLNGGTIAPTGSPSDFAAGVSLMVGAGGVVIDTLPGTVSISAPFLYDASLGGLTKRGAGSLTLTGNSTYTGPTTVSAGTLSLGAGGTAGSVSGPIVNNAGLIVSRSDNLTLPGRLTGTGTLTKLGAGTLSFAGQAAGQPLVQGSLTISGGAVDLTTNALVLRSASLASVRAAVAGGFLRATPAAFTALAAFPNADGSGNAFYASYGDVALLATDLIVRPTYTGDTNIDGRLDGFDLANFIEGFSTGATGWQNGDFNYDNVVNAADYALLASGLAANLPQLTGGPSLTGVGAGGTVPEPGVVGFLPAAALGLRRRRRA